MEFKRPEFSLYPQVYATFKVKVKDSDEEEEFMIQDLTENFYNDAVNIIVENHAKGAVFHSAAKTLVDDTGIQRVREMYRNVFKEKISLICIKMGTKEIAGLNALTIKTKADLINTTPSTDPNFQKLTNATNFIHSAFSVLDHYKVDRFMFAAGLCVEKKFRGRGIATEILKARALLMPTIGIEVTSSIFSTIGAQKAAKAANYTEDYSITYEDFQKEFPDMDFSFAFGASCKVLSLRV